LRHTTSGGGDIARAAIWAGITAALAATALAAGAAADIRLHRLHVPPPPSEASEEAQPDAPGAPAAPGAPSPPPATPPPGSPPPSPGSSPPPPQPPPPTGATSCANGSDGGPADLTGLLSDYALDASPSALAATATLRVSAVNAGSDAHTLAIRPLGGARLCATPTLAGGITATLTVTNISPGTYQLFCTLHPASMNANVTVS
jgi:plastocyanin